MYDISVFESELESIQTPSIRDVVRSLFGLVPSYFWVVPASSSGKYHPAYATGEGGLVRHTKAAVRFCNELRPLQNFTTVEFDFVIAALLLHDTWKQGDGAEGHTVFEHPLLAAGFVKDHTPEWFSEVVSLLIASHMGQWNTSKYAPGVRLPKPKNKLQRFVHECDYLASRKAFDVQF